MFAEAGVKDGNTILQDRLAGPAAVWVGVPRIGVHAWVCYLLRFLNTYIVTAHSFISSSKYWVTRSLSSLKKELERYKIITNNTDADTATFSDCCAFWEDALSLFFPAGDFLEGLRRWGAALFAELTRSTPDPEMDSRTTAKRECIRLSREIDKAGHIVARLARIAFDIDPLARARLVARGQILERKVSLLSNVISELTLLHDSGLDVLVETEHDRILNYQVAVL